MEVTQALNNGNNFWWQCNREFTIAYIRVNGTDSLGMTMFKVIQIPSKYTCKCNPVPFRGKKTSVTLIANVAMPPYMSRTLFPSRWSVQYIKVIYIAPKSGDNRGTFAAESLGVVKADWNQWVLRLCLITLSDMHAVKKEAGRCSNHN